MSSAATLVGAVSGSDRVVLASAARCGLEQALADVRARGGGGAAADTRAGAGPASDGAGGTDRDDSPLAQGHDRRMAMQHVFEVSFFAVVAVPLPPSSLSPPRPAPSHSPPPHRQP